MKTIRFVLINQSRSDALDEMREFVLGEQANSNLMMFNTSFSYSVRGSFFEFLDMFPMISRDWSKKFDMLFAYTFTWKQYDVWVHDNEGGMNDMVEGLARLWKKTLKKSNAQLGIDDEYTKPGILVLLETFKNLLESTEAEPPFEFNYL